MPPPPPPFAAVVNPGLTPDQYRQLNAAGRAMRKIRRASIMAMIDGWSLGVFGVLTAVLGLTDVPSLLIGIALIAICVVELRAARRLRQVMPFAARTLGWNQLALGTLLFAYGAWKLIGVLRGDLSTEFNSALAASDPQLRDLMRDYEGLPTLIFTIVYATVMAIAVLGPGSLALYYFTREKFVRSYLSETPQWIADMQRAGVSI